MSKTEFHFAVINKITMEHEKGSSQSTLKSSDLRLEISGNLDKLQFPTKMGVKAISINLISGIIANIRYGTAKGWWKEEEQLRYIIEELQRTFGASGTLTKGKMEY